MLKNLAFSRFCTPMSYKINVTKALLRDIITLGWFAETHNSPADKAQTLSWMLSTSGMED